MLKNKKVLIVLFIIILVFAVLGTFFAMKNSNNKTTPTTGNDGNYINLNPATDEERKETEEFKKNLEKQSESGNVSTSQANVTITYASFDGSAVSGAGIVSGVFEDGGACTLTLTRAGVKVSGTSTGIADVNKTTCPEISIDRSKLSSGEWTAVLSYNSPKLNGVSQPRSVVVP
jgi:hypothetical protein